MELPDGILYLRAAKLPTEKNEVLQITLACDKGQADGTISRDDNEELFDFVMKYAPVVFGRPVGPDSS